MTTQADRVSRSARGSPTSASFTALTAAELRRWWWRRLTRAGSLLLLGVLAFALHSTWQSTQAPSASELTQNRQAYEQAVTDFPRSQASCREAQTAARAQGDTAADFGCETMSPPTPEMFNRPTAQFPRLMAQLVPDLGLAAAVILFVVGASVVGAEFRSGAISTWLAFEPRRLRVATAKLVAVAGGSVVVAAGLVALTALGVWAVCRLNSTDLDVDRSEYLWVSTTARGVALMTAAGFGGAVVGLLVRNTAGVVGVVVGYAVIVEGVIGSLWRELQPWLLQPNILAWLHDGYRYVVEKCSTGPQGYACAPEPRLLDFGPATVHLVVLGLVLTVAALVTFRRRDVVA